jgi:hypothetical protein
VARDIGWSADSTWALIIDCDEILEISESFSKEAISSDIYLADIVQDQTFYKRQFLVNLGKKLFWEGPIHEMIPITDNTIRVDFVAGARIVYRRLGDSWRGDLEQKFLRYVEKLVEYVNEGHKAFRWLRYIGDSYTSAALAARSRENRRKWLLEAEKYYLEALSADRKERHESYVVYEQLSEIKSSLGREWSEIRSALLDAYAADTRHAEPFIHIIKEYVRKRQFDEAYLYSSFAVLEYHGRTPSGMDIGHVKPSVYQWELLYYHLLVCTNSGRIEESRPYCHQLQAILRAKSVRLNGREKTLFSLLVWQNRIKRSLTF